MTMDLTVLRTHDAPPIEHLQDALNRVNKGIRDAVERVLHEAKMEKTLGELPGRQIDFVREFERRRISALSALRDLERFIHTGRARMNGLDDLISRLGKLDLSNLSIPDR